MMAISLKHNFVSFQTDGPDPTLVQPSNWNEDHVLTQATNRLLGRVSSGAGPTEELVVGPGLTLASGDLRGVFASTAEAEAGVVTDKGMSPATAKAATIATIASTAEAEAGTVNNKLMSPANTKAAIAALAGKIVQVVQAQTSTAVTVSSSTYTDTTLTATITPRSTTSKILVLVDQLLLVGDNDADFAFAGIQLLRGSTVIHTPATNASGPFDHGVLAGDSPDVALYARASVAVLDSPATAGAVTYKTQGRPYIGASPTPFAVFQPAGTSGSISYITLLEIVA
jgi:hypothetical protein